MMKSPRNLKQETNIMVEYYNDSFFEDLASEESKTCRFRAVVQYVNLAFAEAVQLKG